MFSFITVLLTVLRTCWLRVVLFFKKLQINDNCVITEVAERSRIERTNGKNATIAATTISRQKSTGRLRRLPRAKGFPIAGTLFDLIASGGAPRLHHYIHGRHEQLGPIFAERLGSAFAPDAVFVASASLMRSVFLYEGQMPRHPVPDAWTLYNRQYNCQRGLFFMEGAEWLHNRRILNRFLQNGNLDWMNAHIETCTEQLIGTWRQQVCSPTAAATCHTVDNLEHQLYRWSIDVICSIMFGSTLLQPQDTTNFNELESKLEEFAHIVHTIFEHSSALMNFPPQLAKLLRLRKWRDFEQSVTAVLCKGGELIDMLMAQKNQLEGDAIGEEDILRDETLCHKLQQDGMSLTMIKRIFVDLVIAAGDTTAYTSEWALYLLIQNAELQEQIAAAALAASDWKDVSLIRGLIKETLRLYPVAPFIGRYLATDAIIDNHFIKENTLVLLSLYTAGRSVDHFPEPLAVRPERWQQDTQTGQLRGVLQAHGSLPFAIGNRSCIGRRLALNQIQCLITTIVKNFQLDCRNSNETIDCILRLVTVPSQPLHLVIKLR